jgi:hypothetical protein
MSRSWKMQGRTRLEHATRAVRRGSNERFSPAKQATAQASPQFLSCLELELTQFREHLGACDGAA